MRASQFVNTVIGILFAFFLMAVVTVILLFGPWYLCISCSWWWLFFAIPVTPAAWWVIHKMWENGIESWFN